MTTIYTSVDFDQLNIDLYQWPIIISGAKPNVPIVIKFKSDMTFTSADNYFIVNTDYVIFDGANHKINIINIYNYPGLISNGYWNGVNIFKVIPMS